MFETIKLVKNIKSTLEYLKPYFSLNWSNVVRIFTAFFSLVGPVIESFTISSNSKLIFENTTNEKFNTKDIIKLFILSYGIYCLSYSLRSALNKTLVESLKKEIKLNNIKILLNDNNFLSGYKYVDKEHKILSIQEVAFGETVDSFVDQFAESFIKIPGELMSLCMNMYNLSCFTNTNTTYRTVSLTFLLGFLSFVQSKELAKYSLKQQKYKEIISNRSTYIEDRQDEICLTDANKFEHDFMVENIKQSIEDNSRFLKLEFFSSFIQSLSQCIGMCYFNLINPLSENNNVPYLNNIVISLIANFQSFCKYYNEDSTKLFFNLTKLYEFNNLYDKWKECNQKLIKNYNKKEFKLSNVEIKIGEDKLLLLQDVNIEFSNSKVHQLLGKSGTGKKQLY